MSEIYCLSGFCRKFAVPVGKLQLSLISVTHVALTFGIIIILAKVAELLAL